MSSRQSLANTTQRHPYISSILVLLALFLLTLASRAAFPSAPIGDVSNLSPEALRKPSALDQLLTNIKSADTLFWTLAILLSAALLTSLGWLRNSEFNRPSRWRNLYLLILPLAVVAFILSDGLFIAGPLQLVSGLLVIFIAVLGEEIIFRGLLWRAFIPAGPVQTVIVTSLLTGLLFMARSTTDALPEALRLAAIATCGGFTYGALRWRTGSIWPVILIHTALAYAPTVATLGSTKYPILIWISTLGFVVYGLFLLRTQRAREDGG